MSLASSAGGAAGPGDPAPGVMGLLAEIADVGRDPASGGYRRFAFTREDAALGEWFAAACVARGLDVTTDRCGNQWAWWGDPDAAVTASNESSVHDHRGVLGEGRGVVREGRGGIVVGSHLDSVPDGGAFDGPLGIAAALVAVDLLAAQGFTPSRPLGLVRFVDEEGARFGLACSGSRLLTGTASPDGVRALQDADGVSYADAARSAGLDPSHLGRDDETLRRIGAFVELHIEQGRGLGPAPDPATVTDPATSTGPAPAAVAVGNRIRPHGRWRVDLVGRADHAGTTLLADRDDPMLALAALVVAVRAAAQRHDALATVGKVAVRPNAVNAVPSSVTAWLDVRADTAEQVQRVLADLQAGVDSGQPATLVQESWTAATELDPALTMRIGGAVGRAPGWPAGVAVPVLATGAGHDAGVLAQAGVPSSMLFVRNPTGVSHSPAEWAEPQDCESGAVVLAAVLGELLGELPSDAASDQQSVTLRIRSAAQTSPERSIAAARPEGGSLS